MATMDDVAVAAMHSELPSLLPKLNPWIELCDLGNGNFVVKNINDRTYFSTGEEEFFILQQLQKNSPRPELKQRYNERFAESLDDADLGSFLTAIERKGLIPNVLGRTPATSPDDEDDDADAEDDDDPNVVPGQKRWWKQSILFWRVPLVNPDRFLGFVVRLFPWIWTQAFFAASLGLMGLATFILLQSSDDLSNSLKASFRWETLVVLACASVGATILHEIAHGATCKKFGGEVREAGVLFLMLIPCLYVNVSDAWTIPSKRKRMLITAAGGYMDLCVWALCVLLWRVTLPGTFIHYLAFVVASACGARGLMNFNPLLRFDGYYLLSDGLGIPNLYSSGRAYWFAHLAHFLWGAPKPKKVENARLLLGYGLMSWLFALAFLNIVLINMVKYATLEFGVFGLLFGCLLMFYALRRVFRGFLGKEFLKMLQLRRLRLLMWAGGIVACIALLFIIPTRHNVSGEFEVRPMDCMDVPAPIGSFIGQVLVQDGQEIKVGETLCELRSPELISQLETKQAELVESEAQLKRLKAGPRAEELAEQESRVKRLQSWCELGKVEVSTMQTALRHQMEALDHRIKQAEAEQEYAEKVLAQSQRLAQQGAMAPAQLDRERTKLSVLQQRLAEVRAERAALETEGIRVAVAELARREQELADAESKFRLLKLGSRPEDIEAEAARRERLVEELKFLKEQQKSLKVVAPNNGFVRTIRLHEKMGAFVNRGELLCQIEASGSPLVEVVIQEQDALAVKPGQIVTFKARALPLEILEGTVDRIATSAERVPNKSISPTAEPKGQTVVLYCHVEKGAGQLKSGMTGFARIHRGWSSIGRVLQLQAYRYLRTEFWW
jgi:putative peptide zinc metalloprotease protein